MGSPRNTSPRLRNFFRHPFGRQTREQQLWKPSSHRPPTSNLNYADESKSATLVIENSGVVVVDDEEKEEESSPEFGGRVEEAFRQAKEGGRATFLPYVTAGYPTPEDTPSILLAMQEGGASVIELGVPYSDPAADGPTIQRTHEIALRGNTDIPKVLEMVIEARKLGLTIPVILMGYYNPFHQYGEEELCKDAKEAGVDGFLIVDLPPEEGFNFHRSCVKYGLTSIPLIGPTTPDYRIKELASIASTFLYLVSVTGVTGARDSLPDDLVHFVERVRAITDLPLSVGFGISKPSMVQEVANMADGVVVGSSITKAIQQVEGRRRRATTKQRADAVRNVVSRLSSGCQQPVPLSNPSSSMTTKRARRLSQIPCESKLQELEDKSNEFKIDDSQHETPSRFGSFGGQFIPEVLSEPLAKLEASYKEAMSDPDFLAQLEEYRRDFIGGPTPLHKAERLTELVRMVYDNDAATIWLKREDLAHTGAHKINNAMGQALLAKRLGLKRIVAETGAGQHGVAVATACAKLGLDCTIYMGSLDYYERQEMNVLRMKALGAQVIPVGDRGSRATLKDALNEAMRDLVTRIRDTYYLVGSSCGAHPFPTMVRDFQSVIGREIKSQMLEKVGKLPDAVVACVGGGSNAIGAFHPFLDDESVQLYGVEAAGKGVEHDHQHSASLCKGTPGVIQGTYTYVLQDKGQSQGTHSICAGMDHPAVGPEHAYLKETGRAKYTAVTDEEALKGFQLMCQTEGIIPALETSHAIYYAVRYLAKELGPGKDIVINMSGRGDKDMPTISKALDWDV